MLPFSRDEFFDVFVAYNDAVWPMQIVLLALALTCAGIASGRTSSAAVGAILGVLWAWLGVAYHLAFFRTINPAAWGFGGMFLIAAGVFVRAAITGRLRFRRPRGIEGALGATLVVYALAGYPLVGWLAGHRFPAAPTFGLPCPTTIFTLGMLILAERPRPRAVVAIPLLWSAIGSVAAFQLGVTEDFGLLASGVIAAAVFGVELAGALHARGHRRPDMATTTNTNDKPIGKQIDEALAELESVTDEIRVKLHLAGMDANDAWNKKMEPRLLQARDHAREAKEASKAAIHDTVKAFKEFAASL